MSEEGFSRSSSGISGLSAYPGVSGFFSFGIFPKTSEDAPEGKFRIDDGYQVGNDKWTYTRLVVFTDRHQAIVDRYKITKELTAVLSNLSKNINSLTKEDLEVLKSIKV